MAGLPRAPTFGVAAPLSPIAVLLALAALLFAAFFVYQPGLEGPFLLDDDTNIRPTAVDALSWKDISVNVRSGPFNGLSRSLTKLSFALTQFTSGYDPRVFKYQNLLLHLVNGLLIFWLAGILFRDPDRGPGADAARYWPALLAAAIWLLHPLQVSTVLYAVQRLVLLSAFFTLLAVVCYLEGRLLVRKRPWTGAGVMLAGLLVFWPLGLISKENATLLAPAVLLIEAFWLRLRTEPGRERRLVWTLIAVFLIFPIFLGLTYFGVMHEGLLAGYSGRDFGLFERLLTQAHVIWLYLQLILFPIPGNMGLFHDGFPVQRSMDAATLVCIIAIASLLILAYMLRRRAPLIGLGICWFFLWHMLESTILPLELVFEHRNYLALFGIALAAAAVVRALYRHLPPRRALIAGSTALVLLLGLNTASRASTWSSYELFALMEYQRAPESRRAVELMFLLSDRRGDREEADRYLEELIALVPDQTWPLLHAIRSRCGRTATPTELLTEAVSRATSSLVRLARMIDTGSCPNIPPRYVLAIAEALGRNPRVHASTIRIGALNLWAVTAAQQNDFATAKDTLRQALRIAVGVAPAWVQATVQAAADTASRLGSYEEAMAFLDDVTNGFGADLRAARVSATLALPPGSGAGRSDS
jgi:hypothetical protein